jgi:hypothetical protein
VRAHRQLACLQVAASLITGSRNPATRHLYGARRPSASQQAARVAFLRSLPGEARRCARPQERIARTCDEDRDPGDLRGGRGDSRYPVLPRLRSVRPARGQRRQQERHAEVAGQHQGPVLTRFGAPLLLLRNQGDGTFEGVTEGSGLEDGVGNRPGQPAGGARNGIRPQPRGLVRSRSGSEPPRHRG